MKFYFETEINIDDIASYQMQMVAEACGLNDALVLMERLPGLELYIPAAAKKSLDWEYVKTNYTGRNGATVAGHLGLNRSDVIRMSKQPAPMDGILTNSHLRLVADRCGIDVAKRLSQTFPCTKIYVPLNGLLKARKSYIERSFNGANTQELALKCRVSERYVRKVIAAKHESAAQVSLFDTH